MEKKTKPAQPGNIDINEVIKVVKESASACYGVVAIAGKADTFRPDKQIKKGIKEDAIYVRKLPNRTFTVDVYLVLSNEVKITESLVEAQKVVMYNLNKKFNKACTQVNVYGEKIDTSR